MKKIMAGLSIATMTLTVAGFAGAATINSVSGGSSAASTATSSLKLKVSNSNTASITNSVTTGSDSGDNTVRSKFDQNGTMVTTGNVTAAAVVDNAANSNETDVTSDVGGSGGSNISNVTAGSAAATTDTDTVKHKVTNSNTVSVDNSITAGGTTGGNLIRSKSGTLNNVTLGTGTSDTASGLTNTFNVNLQSVTRTIHFH